MKEILNHDKLELAFVWNRTVDVLLAEVEEKYVLRDLEDFGDR